jgi:hypothetical protein
VHKNQTHKTEQIDIRLEDLRADYTNKVQIQLKNASEQRASLVLITTNNKLRMDALEK